MRVLADRVAETTTTTGTGSVTLAGAVAGFRRFDDVMTNGQQCYYVIEALDGSGNPSGDWESGVGTYSGSDVLARTEVRQSSNGGAAVNFSAGTKRVILTPTADAEAERNATVDVMTVLVSDPNGLALTTGDGKAFIPIPSTMDGRVLIKVVAYVTTASSSGAPTVQLHNMATAADILTTPVTIDASELTSATAATPAVIDGTENAVSAGDVIRIDVDAAGTGTKGLIVELQYDLAPA